MNDSPARTAGAFLSNPLTKARNSLMLPFLKRPRTECCGGCSSPVHLLRQLVAQGGVQVMRIVVGDPGFEAWISADRQVHSLSHRHSSFHRACWVAVCGLSMSAWLSASGSASPTGEARASV